MSHESIQQAVITFINGVCTTCGKHEIWCLCELADDEGDNE